MTVPQGLPDPLVKKIEVGTSSAAIAKTKLGEVLAEKEETAARRYSAAELEKMAIQSENEARALRGEPPLYKGGGMTDEEKATKEAKELEQRQQLITQAKMLIDSGLDPKQIGQMLMALPSIGMYPGPANGGMTFDNVVEIVKLVKGGEDKESGLTRAIASLETKIEKLSSGGGKTKEEAPIDPFSYATKMAQAQSAWHKALVDTGVVPSPEEIRAMRSGGGGGDKKNLEVVKEENRHNEKMEEIKVTREHNEEMMQLAATIPERVGKGAASLFMEQSQNNPNKSKGLETFKCDCGSTIYVTPETGNRIKCAKCGMVYERDNIPI